MSIFLEQHLLGNMDNYIYLLGEASSKRVAVVDPGWEVPFLVERVAELGVSVECILLTHGHFDHAQGVSELLGHFDVPVYLSSHEAPQLTPDVPNLVRTDHNEVINVAGLEVTCLHTPGHTPGGQCFYVAPHLIVGDTMFVDGCGRCDFAYSSVDDMYVSLHETIGALPDETIIYPGHAYGGKPHDTLGAQRKSNPFLRKTEKDQFILHRLG